MESPNAIEDRGQLLNLENESQGVVVVTVKLPEL